MHPLELVIAAPWRRVAFTTYALSLSFFEAVVLDAMIRGGARNAIVFADPTGIKAALSEHGARRVGREYDVEPVACLTGSFHPKIGIFSSDDDCHVTIGSGNLTFGGWGGNAEVIEHLHPSFAADAFDDLADMLELLTISEQVRTGASDSLLSLAQDVRRGAIGATRTGNIRVVHSVGGSIAGAITAAADELGGATGLTVVSPFFDRSGHALRRLAQDLHLSSIAVHVHPKGPVRGSTGLNWPGALEGLIIPVRVNEDCVTADRALHAKAFEITCRRGRMLVSGSANATTAALYTGNVEASVLRIQRETHVGWTCGDASHPLWPELEADDDEDFNQDKQQGVLRAVLNGGLLSGMVVSPTMSGTASLSCVFSAGKLDIGSVTLHNGGSFSATATELEALTWSGGRLVIRIEQGSRCAEGFLSITAATEIIRRAGALAARLMAMLAGTETPADVAAILSWFREEPRRLDVAGPSMGGSGENSRDPAPLFVPIGIGWTDEGPPNGECTSDSAGEPAWRRAMSMVISAFAVRRGPWDVGQNAEAEADEEDDETPAERARRLADAEAARLKASDAFGDLLDVMLAPANGGRHVATALAIARYLAERSGDPHLTDAWLQRIVPAARRVATGSNPMLVTAAIAMFSSNHERGAVRCRRYLLRLGIDPNRVQLEAEVAPAFAAVIERTADVSKFLAEMASVRTSGEQVQCYLDSFSTPPPHNGFPILREAVEWPRLAKALVEPEGRRRLRVHSTTPTACPDCHIAFPLAKIEDLRRFGVTECCRVNLSTEV